MSRFQRSVALALAVSLAAFRYDPTPAGGANSGLAHARPLSTDSADVAATVQAFHAALQSGDSTAVLARGMEHVHQHDEGHVP